MIIRKPNPQELESTLVVLDYQVSEQNIDYDENNLIQTVKTHMSRATHCWLNAYQGTRPVGVIGGCVAQDNWTGDRFAIVNFFYVLPTHQNQGLEKQLLEEFELWAKTVECKQIVGGDINVDYNNVFDSLGFAKKNIWIKE
jgi:GNAT superfamily N-acetyltransferase